MTWTSLYWAEYCDSGCGVDLGLLLACLSESQLSRVRRCPLAGAPGTTMGLTGKIKAPASHRQAGRSIMGPSKACLLTTRLPYHVQALPRWRCYNTPVRPAAASNAPGRAGFGHFSSFPNCASAQPSARPPERNDCNARGRRSGCSMATGQRCMRCQALGRVSGMWRGWEHKNACPPPPWRACAKTLQGLQTPWSVPERHTSCS